jgi:hypothetical protein
VGADFISYHDYSCTNYPTTAQGKTNSVANTAGDIQWNYNQVISEEKRYYGAAVPTGVTEWNFDPGFGFLSCAASDNHFMFQYTEAALRGIEATGMAFANEFTSLNYAGYSDLDMFRDSAPYAPKAQYYGMVDMGEKAGTGSKVAIPAF